MTLTAGAVALILLCGAAWKAYKEVAMRGRVADIDRIAPAAFRSESS